MFSVNNICNNIKRRRDITVWTVNDHGNALTVFNKDKKFGEITLTDSKQGLSYNGRDIERFPKNVQKQMNEWMEKVCLENNFKGIWDIEAFLEW